jgi:DNA repair protein RecO (recombination protein O)
MSMLHKTKGVVLRAVRYGETSLVATLFTEAFGVQSYMVKGVRRESVRSTIRAAHFQPATLLDLVVTHHSRAGLQHIRECRWSCLLTEVGRDIRKQSVALFMMELLLKCLRQPEPQPELFTLTEESLLSLEAGGPGFAANFPIHFAIRLARLLGFHLEEGYRDDRPYLDLQEGVFLSDPPMHPYAADRESGWLIDRFIRCPDASAAQEIPLEREARRRLLDLCLLFLSLHVPDFGKLRSLPVLQELLD